MQFDHDKILNELLSLSEPDYRKFHMNLVPGIDNILGIRLPNMRSLAKRILKSEFGDYKEYIKNPPDYYYEEIMLQGLVIAGMKTKDIEEQLGYIRMFVPKINNWAICDSFCSSLKSADKYQEIFYEFILPYISSPKEFERRFALIMLLFHYVKEKYIDDILRICDSINRDGYYVKMAVAWLISLCFIKFEDKTWDYLKDNNLDKFTYNKALQKIIESNRVSVENKEQIRTMK